MYRLFLVAAFLLVTPFAFAQGVPPSSAVFVGELAPFPVFPGAQLTTAGVVGGQSLAGITVAGSTPTALLDFYKDRALFDGWTTEAFTAGEAYVAKRGTKAFLVIVEGVEGSTVLTGTLMVIPFSEWQAMLEKK